MPAKRYVAEELPYAVLKELYKNSRLSFRELGRKLNVSHNTIATVVKNYREKYRIEYALELNEKALGFSEGRIITIKFGTPPGAAFLKEKFRKDIFVQDAYLATGDFDVLLYVVGLTQHDFQNWQFNLRVALSEYKPLFRFSTTNAYIAGFFPLRNEILRESVALSDREKRVLLLLNENPRMKLSEIVKRSRLTHMRVIYITKKLKARGVIKRFSALTQNPEKRLFVAYAVLMTFIAEHEKLALRFAMAIVDEDPHEITNDYCLIADDNGANDMLYICDFENGEKLSERGPELTQKLWSAEDPNIRKAILTDLLMGKWPFHLEDYDEYRRFIAERGHILEA